MVHQDHLDCREKKVPYLIYYYSETKRNYAIYLKGQKGERGPVGEKGLNLNKR